MDLKSFSERQSLKILSYGDTGTGKSIRAASAASWGPAFIFDFDGKISSLYEFYKAESKILENLHYDTFLDANPDKPTACTRAYEKLREISAACAAGKIPYATVIFDSWTAWEGAYLNQVMATNPTFKRMRVPTGTGSAVTVPDQADYRIHAHAQSTFIPQLLSLPMNVFVICHTQIKSDEITGRIEYGVGAAGKLMKTIPKFFGEVHRSFVDKGRYRVQVRSDDRFPANTRLKDVPSDGTIDAALTPFSHMAFTL